eukprot:TRINITY_DN48343_c0_g1_i1.p1 TRINITY_DN48343_c0_g1~~TRINITY_DN48343_c0_g1_i1.p1  ORF type:complete len:498 (+),score=103.80 TRINITY_DN48343_c0_g1_i1:91-1584(+)
MLPALLAFSVLCQSGLEGAAGSKIKKVSTQLWKQCAIEGELVGVPGLVRFGWDQDWVEKELPAGATCSLAAFGKDPISGIRKVCECAEGPPASPAGASLKGLHKEELGQLWERCALENQICRCDSGLLRFGEDNRWVGLEKGARGGTAICNADAFGEDPSSDHTKECWCALSQKTVQAAKVAIVMLSRHPPDLLTWLRYHLHHVGVQHVFIKAEESPTIEEAMSQLSSDDRSRVTLWKLEAIDSLQADLLTAHDSRPQDDYTTLQSRQMTTMARAKEESEKMGIDWLIHIDDDELLYAPQHRKIGDLLANMPENFLQAYMPNVEAVYESADVKSCFMETKKVNLNRVAFQSYANGKAAVRIGKGEVRPAGPHQWRDVNNAELNSIHMDKEPFGAPVMVVHFESCPFSRWQDKFWELGNTSPDQVRKIPFPFYRDSITTMQKCKTASSMLLQGDALSSLGCDESSLKDLWSRWKTALNPRLLDKDFMPISIPWSRIID